MIEVLLAAALSTTAAQPLFVPPRAFRELKSDRVEAQRLQRSGYRFITEYRSRSVVITLGKAQGFGLNAASFAQARLQSLQKSVPGIHVISSRAVPICDSRRGWVVALTMPRGNDVTEQLFADSNDSMYLALLRYPKATGDLQASRALESLCPPPTAHAVAQNRPIPFTVPPNWSSGDVSRIAVSPPVTAEGMWLRPSVTSHFIETLNLFKAPALAEGATPDRYIAAMLGQEQQSLEDFQLKTNASQRLCGDTLSGWFDAFSGVHDGKALDIEQVTAFGENATYALQYVRLRGSPEDPQARKALLSLCPPDGS